MLLMFTQDLFTEIRSPLDQFEVRDILNLEVLGGNLHLSLTNIGLYLLIGGLMILVLSLVATNYNKLVSNNWSIAQESLYVTIHNIVTNQINARNGQIYFPFIYTLFVFILINNLIGMVKRCLRILFIFNSNNLNFAGYFVAQKKLYSSYSHLIGSAYTHIKTYKNKTRYSFNNKNTFYLNPYYITGFIDGEGCFSISIFKDSRRLIGWQVKPVFSIYLHNKDLNLLEAIQRTFGVGKIYKHGNDSMQYRVSSLNNLLVITEHFDKYPLITKKKGDYILFKQAISIIKNKEHLSLTGLLKLVSIKATLNWGLSQKFKESFPIVEPISKPKVDIAVIKNLNWIRGFIEAEGSFQVITQEIKNKIHVSLRFSITQHIKDEILLNNIVTYLNCGRYYRWPVRNEGQYIVTVFSDIYEKIIPLLDEYPLLGIKKEDSLDFLQTAELIKSKSHLTEEGIAKIKSIKNNMNKRRINL